MIQTRVYVGGTFDLFHAGHVELLRRAAKLGPVWVALNSDDYAASFKERPIMDYGERAAVLLACEYVEAVICCDNDERGLIEMVHPRVIVYANDGSYTRESYMERLKVDQDFLDRWDIRIKFLDYTQGVSSTDVIKRVLGRHRTDGVQAQEHVPPDAPCPCRLDEDPGRVLDGVRDGGGCPCR